MQNNNNILCTLNYVLDNEIKNIKADQLGYAKKITIRRATCFINTLNINVDRLRYSNFILNLKKDFVYTFYNLIILNKVHNK
jgi:hypothetical protein